MQKKVKRPAEEKKKGKPEDLPYNPEVTKEDKQALNQKGRSMNKGQDKDLDREKPVDFTAHKMDVPASNQNKPSKEGEIPDEQNWQYNKKGSPKARDMATDHKGSDKKIKKH